MYYAIPVSPFLPCLFLSACMSHAAGPGRDANRNRADMVRDSGKTRLTDEIAKEKIGQRRHKKVEKTGSAFLPIWLFLLYMPKLQPGNHKAQ